MRNIKSLNIVPSEQNVLKLGFYKKPNKDCGGVNVPVGYKLYTLKQQPIDNIDNSSMERFLNSIKPLFNNDDFANVQRFVNPLGVWTGVYLVLNKKK